MSSTTTKPRKGPFTPPAAAWSDPIVRRLRTNGTVDAAYDLFSRRLVPMLFAVFVAAPIGAVIVWFFIPKFIRNARRRSRYSVTMHETPRERIAGTYRSGPAAG